MSLRVSLISSYFILENEKKVQDERQRQKGSCFSYLFCLIIIINSFLDQCLQGLVPEVMVSGMDLFQKLKLKLEDFCVTTMKDF